jgi:hypothetical protein
VRGYPRPAKGAGFRVPSRRRSQVRILLHASKKESRNPEKFYSFIRVITIFGVRKSRYCARDFARTILMSRDATGSACWVNREIFVLAIMKHFSERDGYLLFFRDRVIEDSSQGIRE